MDRRVGRAKDGAGRVQRAPLRQTRKGPNAVTDFLSALLLCLTAAVALVSGPLSPGAGGQSSAGHTSEIGEHDQTPAPVESKRTTFAMEAQASSGFAAQDDGKAKAALPPATFRLPRPSLEARYRAAPSVGIRASGGRDYSARAPPSLS